MYEPWCREKMHVRVCGSSYTRIARCSYGCDELVFFVFSINSNEEVAIILVPGYFYASFCATVLTCRSH